MLFWVCALHLPRAHYFLYRLYGHKFAVSHMIPCFSGCELLAEKGHRLATLWQLSTQCHIRCITMQHKGLLIVRQRQHRCWYQPRLQFSKGTFLFRTPHKSLLPRQQIADWGCNSGKVWDEHVVIIGKTKELLHPFDVSGGFPVCHSNNLTFIRTKFPRANHMAQVLQPILAKVTFLKLSMQLVLLEAIKYLPEISFMIICIPISVHKDII